jgi:Tfp pilus assembly protein PilN
MPRINLLPVRVLRRQEAARQELLLAGGVVAFAAFALFLWHGVLSGHVSDALARKEAVSGELTALQVQVSKIDAFKAEAEALEKKLAIIDTLTQQRHGPARLLDAIAAATEALPRVWLVSVAQSEAGVTLEGGAIDQEDISALQLALGGQPRLFGTPKLSLITAVHEGEAAYLQWAMQCAPVAAPAHADAPGVKPPAGT